MTLPIQVVVSGWSEVVFEYRAALLDRILRDWLQNTGFAVMKNQPPPAPEAFGGSAPRASFSIRDPQGAEIALISTVACELSAPQFIDFILPLLVEFRAREIFEVRRLISEGGPKSEVEKPGCAIVLRRPAAPAPQVEAEMIVEQIARLIVDRVEAGKSPEDGRVSLIRLHGLAGMRRDHVEWDRYEAEAGALVKKMLEERSGRPSSA